MFLLAPIAAQGVSRTGVALGLAPIPVVGQIAAGVALGIPALKKLFGTPKKQQRFLAESKKKVAVLASETSRLAEETARLILETKGLGGPPKEELFSSTSTTKKPAEVAAQVSETKTAFTEPMSTPSQPVSITVKRTGAGLGFLAIILMALILRRIA